MPTICRGHHAPRPAAAAGWANRPAPNFEGLRWPHWRKDIPSVADFTIQSGGDCRTKGIWEGGRQIKVSACLRILFRSLHSLYSLWSQKEILTLDQLILYDKSIATLHKSWLALGWKPAVWVHWVCAHSSFYVHTFRTIYSFTSIPTEHRHQKFKMDLRHAFEGWKFANPLVTSCWLTRFVNLDTLDQGLHLLSLTNEVGTDAIFKRQTKKRKLDWLLFLFFVLLFF